MATDSVIKGKSINTDKVSFSAPNVLDNGAKLVYVNYNGGKFTVQTPWMDMLGRCPIYRGGISFIIFVPWHGRSSGTSGIPHKLVEPRIRLLMVASPAPRSKDPLAGGCRQYVRSDGSGIYGS